MPTLYDRLKAEGLEPPESVKLIGDRKPTEAEIAYARTLEADLKAATEDAKICSWVLAIVAQGHRMWERGYAGQVAEWAGKISGYYVGEQARNMIEWWARKAILAFKQGAD